MLLSKLETKLNSIYSLDDEVEQKQFTHPYVTYQSCYP